MADRKYDTPYSPPDNGGNMFPNRYKREGTKEPDWRGEVMVNGVRLQISAWKEVSRTTGNEFFSLKFSPPYVGPRGGGGGGDQRREPPRQDQGRNPPDDEIPF